MTSRCIGSVAQNVQGKNVLLLDKLKLMDFQGVAHRHFDVSQSVYQDLRMYCCCFQLREVLCWFPMSYLLGFMFIFLITKGLVHFGLVCNIHQPELHRGMTFESKAFLCSNDKTGEKYGDTSQQINKKKF